MQLHVLFAGIKFSEDNILYRQLDVCYNWQKTMIKKQPNFLFLVLLKIPLFTHTTTYIIRLHMYQKIPIKFAPTCIPHNLSDLVT